MDNKRTASSEKMAVHGLIKKVRPPKFTDLSWLVGLHHGIQEFAHIFYLIDFVLRELLYCVRHAFMSRLMARHGWHQHTSADDLPCFEMPEAPLSWLWLLCALCFGLHIVVCSVA